jgi:hypothetical protein|eukprot:COSAG06_NODE_1036_length_10998_cov_27.475181_8_plen_54_part_00
MSVSVMIAAMQQQALACLLAWRAQCSVRMDAHIIFSFILVLCCAVCAAAAVFP